MDKINRERFWDRSCRSRGEQNFLKDSMSPNAGSIRGKKNTLREARNRASNIP
jgi:hypothetical protein